MSHSEIFKKASPEFIKLAAAYNALSFVEKRSPEGQKLFDQMIVHAPDELIQLFFNKAQEMNLVPDAAGYLDNGDPVYSLEDIAEIHGISLYEALEVAKEMGIEAQLINSDDVHRVN